MKKHFFTLILLLGTMVAMTACNKEVDPVEPENPTDTIVPEAPAQAVTITIDNILPDAYTCTFTKADSCTAYFILTAEPGSIEPFLAWSGFTTVEQAVEGWGIKYTESATYTWKDQTPNTDYVIYALARCPHGDVLITDTIRTAVLGGHGASVITVSVSNITSTTVTTTATPNDQTAVFHDLIISKEYFDSIGVDSTIALLKADYYPHYSTDVWQWMDLTPGTEYYFVAIGKNADDVWGEMAKTAFTTL